MIESQACADDVLNVGFYAFFAPVSYSADEDPESDGYNTHLGYESDLLTALEAMQDALTSDVRIGALAGTTGEARLLQLVGLVDAEGVLAAGVQVDTPEGTAVADGSADYVITAAGESPNLAGRTHLRPAAETMPQVIYLGDETGETELLDALGAAEIDAVARGEIGNQDAAYASEGAFVMSALDDASEYGGFTVAVGSELLACLDEKINRLTDSRSIGYGEWVENPAVFIERAEMWNERESSEE